MTGDFIYCHKQWPTEVSELLGCPWVRCFSSDSYQAFLEQETRGYSWSSLVLFPWWWYLYFLYLFYYPKFQPLLKPLKCLLNHSSKGHNIIRICFSSAWIGASLQGLARWLVVSRRLIPISQRAYLPKYLCLNGPDFFLMLCRWERAAVLLSRPSEQLSISQKLTPSVLCRPGKNSGNTIRFTPGTLCFWEFDYCINHSLEKFLKEGEG